MSTQDLIFGALMAASIAFLAYALRPLWQTPARRVPGEPDATLPGVTDAGVARHAVGRSRHDEANDGDVDAGQGDHAEGGEVGDGGGHGPDGGGDGGGD